MAESVDMKKLLEGLHLAVANGLKERIESGEATGAEFSAAINLLKNNSINCDIETNDTLNELQERLKKRSGRFKVTEEDKENVINFRRDADG